MDPTEITPDVPFGGDFTKAVEAHKNIQALQTTTANERNALQLQLTEATTKLNAPPPTPPIPTPPTNTGEPTGGVNFDFSNGAMKMEDGTVNPQLIETFAKIGVDASLVQNFVGHMENSVAYNTHLNNTLIAETVGSQENFNEVSEWGQANLAPDLFSQITQGLNQRATMKYAMQDLMEKAEEGGFRPSSAPPVKPVTTEPTPLPASTGGTTGLTALYPNTAESRAAVTDPRYVSDPAYRQSIQNRLAAGMKHQQ